MAKLAFEGVEDGGLLVKMGFQPMRQHKLEKMMSWSERGKYFFTLSESTGRIEGIFFAGKKILVRKKQDSPS